MELIDKSSLVAEIEKRLDELYSLLPDASKVENGMITILEACNTGKYTALESILSLVKEELEVKEVQEESASDDLEEAVDGYTSKVLERTNCLIGNQFVGEEISEAVKFGAKWQKEQMMAKAINGKVLANGMGIPILHLWDKGKYLIDKKVKVIVIKED